MRDAIDADLVFGHGFEQRALRARRRAVDLVGEQQLGEQRAGVEAEAAIILVEDRHAEDVGGQQVGGELHALELEAQRGRERASECCLAEAGQVFDQQVAIGQQGGEGEMHLAAFAEHQGIDLLDRRVERFAGPGG